MGVAEEENGIEPREVLMNEKEFFDLKLMWFDGKLIVNEEESCRSLKKNRVSMYNNKIDYMTGEDFELYVAQMLGK